jgi:hypothetical protein
VLHQLTGGQPLARKFRDKEYLATAHGHLQLASRSKTETQFKKVLALFLAQWAGDGHPEAAKHAYKGYGTFPYNNWWTNVTRVPGITPQGSLNESYNVNCVKGSKKVAPVVLLNVSMQIRFLGSSLPAILENDANNNLGECSICIPTN